jgi:hypothetical protein
MQGTERGTRDDAWRTVAQEQNGEAVEGRRKLKQVRFPHRAWLIVLDQYTVSTGKSTHVYTRLRALFEPHLEFRFAIFRENFFARVAKFFGMQDVHTGDVLLDRDYVVRTDNESMMRSLVAGSRIGSLLIAQKSGKLEIAKFRGRKKPRPERAAELRWVAGGVIKDADRLRLAVDLLRATLDRMREIGAAREGGIDYEL